MFAAIIRSEAESPAVAYFSMEFGLDPALPTYSGGLGMLAGDHVRAAADNALPLVGLTLLYHKGYFRQHLDAAGNQTESPFQWDPSGFLEDVGKRVSINIEGRKVAIRAWRYVVKGTSNYSVPVYFLDTGLQENSAQDQALSATMR